MSMPRSLSREAHIWYTILSPEYMDRAFAHLKRAYDTYLAAARQSDVAGDYAPVGYWGRELEGQVLNYANARAQLAHGNYREMVGLGGTVTSAVRGLTEGNTAWLGSFGVEFWNELEACSSVANCFNQAINLSQRLTHPDYLDGTTDFHEQDEDCSIPGDDIVRYYEEHVFPVLPTEIPEYAADQTIACKTGERVPWTGMWVPTKGMGKAALAFARKGLQIMQPAYHLVVDDPDTGDEEYELEDCVWHPVKPTGRLIPHPSTAMAQAEVGEQGALRCMAGEPCPKTGWWSTPAKENSRRRFTQGEKLPELASDYGATIWQWDADQA